MCLTDSLLTGILLICSFNRCFANSQYIIMAAFNALGTWGAIFLLHQFRGLQVSFGLQGSREPRRVVQWASKVVINFNPQGSREPRQQNYPNLLHIPPNILCIMLFSPQFNQFSPFTQPAFTAFSSVFQVRISQAFHVSLAFAPGLKGSQLTETNSTYILHNPSFPAYILHAAKPLPPPTDTLSIQASFVPDIWLPA